MGYICYAPIHNLRPASKPVDRLRSGSAYPVSKRVRCKLAYCVDRVGVQARATCSHGDRYDAALTETLTLGYSENWSLRVTTRDEKLCFHLSVHSKLKLDSIEDSCAEELIANYSVSYCAGSAGAAQAAQARPQYSMNVLVIVMHLTVQAAQACI